MRFKNCQPKEDTRLTIQQIVFAEGVIELVAQAILGEDTGEFWDDIDAGAKFRYTQMARAAIEAVGPQIRS